MLLLAKSTWIYWQKVVTLQPKQWKKVADMLPPIVYGIIDIGKVLETQRFYVVFPKTMQIRFKIGLKRKTHIPYASV